jgi:hypothetical protein
MKAALPVLALALAAALASCAPAAKPPAVVSRVPPQAIDHLEREPVLALPAAIDGEGWMNAPLTPGRWEYVDVSDDGAGFARFGTGPSERRFMMECMRGSVLLGVVGSPESSRLRTIRISTETLSRTFETSHWRGMHAVFLPPAEPLLDAIAFSKGRFAVEVAGLPTLYLPSHAEVSRVIEDCR